MNLPSRYLQDAVDEFSKLPGIGKKTALRLVLHLLNKETSVSEQFSKTIVDMRQNIKFCQKCHNISDDKTCSICTNPVRKQTQICIVESIKDVLALENTRQFNGVFHVLSGLISPINGIGPDQLNIQSLINRIKEDEVEEVIMALTPSVDGDTTIFYISKQLKDLNVKITTLARGISFGGELEYADELTLARSLQSRMPYENYLIQK